MVCRVRLCVLGRSAKNPMIEIKDKARLQHLLSEEEAMLFFHVTWSEYSTISKGMIEMVERYAKMGEYPTKFYQGTFEGDLIELTQSLTELGVPDQAFGGNGSLALFKCGKLTGFIQSVIGEGNHSVWKLIKP